MLPEDRFGRNIIYIRRFCDHINVLYIFYRFEVRLEVYDGSA